MSWRKVEPPARRRSDSTDSRGRHATSGDATCGGTAAGSTSGVREGVSMASLISPPQKLPPSEIRPAHDLQSGTLLLAHPMQLCASFGRSLLLLYEHREPQG